MKNKIQNSKIFTLIVIFVRYSVYLFGAMKIADWVVDNVGSSPTSSFYGLITLIILLLFMPNVIPREESSSENKK